MKKYWLSFISDINLFSHVKDTVSAYRFSVSLKDFNENLIDPIKMTFDSKVYSQTLEQTIQNEIMRQIDKSNTNHIGYFHQNIFKYFDSDWIVPKEWYDVINEKKKIFVEMKNKHNTMNSSSSQKTYIRMQNTILQDPYSTCYLVEVIAKDSQDIPWLCSVDKIPMKDNRIRRMSIDKFYALVTGETTSFKQLCQVLPIVIEDVVDGIIKESSKNNTVLSELLAISPNLLQSLYLMSFDKYEGFKDFSFLEF